MIMQASHGSPNNNAAHTRMFIADAMLGRLAKWLRFLGFDVLYFQDIEDRMLIRIARTEGRTILTRDSHFLEQKKFKAVVFIESEDLEKQLLEIRNKLDLKDVPSHARCSVCNGLLERLPSKEDVSDAVPDFIYHNIDHFIRCRDCSKVYWEGTHLAHMKEKIRDIIICSTAQKREHENSEN